MKIKLSLSKWDKKDNRFSIPYGANVGRVQLWLYHSTHAFLVANSISALYYIIMYRQCLHGWKTVANRRIRYRRFC